MNKLRRDLDSDLSKLGDIRPIQHPDSMKSVEPKPDVGFDEIQNLTPFGQRLDSDLSTVVELLGLKSVHI